MTFRARYLCRIVWLALAIAVSSACTAELGEQELLAKSQEHEAKGEINAAITALERARNYIAQRQRAAAT